MTENRWLSTDDIAAYLGVKRDTIYKWRVRHQMPAHRIGKLWKFRQEEVDAWVHSGAHRKPIGGERVRIT